MEPFPALPLPPGESPFHIKGVVLLGLMEYVEDHVPGGMREVRTRLLDPAVRAFSDQTFLAVGWYDFLPVLHMLGAASLAARSGPGDFIAAHAAWQARRDVHGIYRVLLKLSSPEAVGRRLPIAFARYFDFGRVEVNYVSRGVSDVTVHQLPALLLDWYKSSVHSAAVAMLELAGARKVESAYSEAEPDGLQAGVPTVRFNVHRTWS